MLLQKSSCYQPSFTVKWSLRRSTRKIAAELTNSALITTALNQFALRDKQVFPPPVLFERQGNDRLHHPSIGSIYKSMTDTEIGFQRVRCHINHGIHRV